MRPIPQMAGKAAAKPVPIGAPVGGWNARDALANMKPTEAIILDNLFPRTTDVMLRKGSKLFATLPADTQLSPHKIRSLLGYKPTSGTAKLFAGCSDGLYEVTTGGTVTSIASAATGNEWSSLMMTTPGGSFLWCCNGVDDSRYYDGSTWKLLNAETTPALTGLSSNSIKQATVFKNRIFVVPRNSLSMWYLPVNSIAGLAVEYPCGALFDEGGQIVSVDTWTLDAGNGADDYLAVFTSEGECAVFTGTDPSNAANWALKGVYKIPKPIGNRCTFKYGGDLCVITVNGILPLSTALQSSTIDRSKALTDKINLAFNAFSTTFGSNFGWQPSIFSEATMLLINIPLSFERSYQFVMNTLTGAWCRFTGWNAECLLAFNGKLYYAAGNTVHEAWTGASDSSANINASCKQAFNYFRDLAIKHAGLIRPIFTATANLNCSVGIDADFEDNNPSSSAATYAQDAAFWDLSRWDQIRWTAGSLTVSKWLSVNHRPGRALALRLRFSTKNVDVTWSATEFIITSGGLM